MASIEITSRDLVVRIRGLDRVLALRSQVSVPLGHVVDVREHAAEASFDDAVVDSSRGVGTFVRGRIAAGSLQLPDGRAFYDVHDPRKAIVIDLESEPFHHLVVEIDDEPPEAAVRRIREARDALERRSVAHLHDARATAPRLALAPALYDDPPPSLAGEREPLPAWKRTLAAAGAVLLLPVGAIAFVFLAPALLPLLFLGLPRFAERQSPSQPE